MSWIIYKHTNKINGKIYIGQTCQKLNDRWQEGKGYSNCRLFGNAVRKYGWNGFTHEILEDNIQTQEEANKKESYYIGKFNSYVRVKGSHGYNLTPGGDSTGENWEGWEDEILINNYHEVGADKCLKIINDKWKDINSEYLRTRQSIYTRAMRLNIKKTTFWNDEKDSIIKQYYEKEGRNCYKRINGATKKMCEWRASFFGLKFGGFWRDDEIQKLKENYYVGRKYLLDLFPDKTLSQIAYKINHLHLKQHPLFVCYETGKEYTSFTVAEKETGAVAAVISSCLSDETRSKTSGGYHWCWKEELLNGWCPNKQSIKNAKKVYCVQTRRVYDSITIAKKETGCSNISGCCRNHLHQSRDKNGTLLNWCFLEDKDSFIFIEKKSSWNAHKIVCIETKEVFNSIKYVLSKYPNISRSSLYRALKDNSKLAGDYHWQYKFG